MSRPVFPHNLGQRLSYLARWCVDNTAYLETSLKKWLAVKAVRAYHMKIHLVLKNSNLFCPNIGTNYHVIPTFTLKITSHTD